MAKAEPHVLRRRLLHQFSWNEEHVSRLLQKLHILIEDRRRVRSSTLVVMEFLRFDASGDRRITHNALKHVLQQLDASTWTADHVAMLYSAMDEDSRGSINFKKFF